MLKILNRYEKELKLKDPLNYYEDIEIFFSTDINVLDNGTKAIESN